MIEELEDVLQHHGVLGMKWGRRKSQNGSTSSSKPKEPGRIKQELNSLKRERQWKKVAKNVDSMSTKDIQKVSNRISLENDLRRLAKKKDVGSKNDKADYRKREKMTDEVLMRKVGRLRAKDNLHKSITDASRSQVELGKKVAAGAMQLGLKKATGQKIGPEDLFKATKADSHKVKDQAVKSFLDSQAKKDKRKMNAHG